LRQQLQHLQGLVAQIEESRFDVLCRCLDFRDALDPSCEERVTLEKVQDAKPPLALTDCVVPAVWAGDITQQARLGPHPMQIDRDRIIDAGLALENQPHGSAEAHGRLRRKHRALAAECDRQHRARKEDEVARRDQDQRILGECRNAGQRRFGNAGGGGRGAFRCAQFTVLQGHG